MDVDTPLSEPRSGQLSLGDWDDCAALAGAVATRFAAFTAVPGAPVSHLADLLARLRPELAWSTNEKVAVESAVGSSLAGARAVVVMKHNGLGLALDSLANAAVHSIDAALVVIVGDDPGATSSTSNLDTRALGAAARIPVLLPSLCGDGAEILDLAVRASEMAGLPVIVRLSPRVHADCRARARLGASASASAAGAASVAGTVAAGVRRDRRPVDEIAHSLTKLGRIQHHGLALDLAHGVISDATSDRSPCIAAECTDAVIAVGDTYATIRDLDICARLVRAHPSDLEPLRAFAQRHSTTLVLEEPDTLVEEGLRSLMRGNARVVGRLTGHLRRHGDLTAEHVAQALSGRTAPPPAPESKSAAPPLAEHYGKVYEAIGALRRAGTFVATDVGSSVRLCYPPYEGADAAVALGASIAVAAGAARVGVGNGVGAVAVVGDYGLLHSGLPALVDATSRGLGLLVVVLANGIQAKTGGQPVVPVDLAAMVRACGVATVAEWADTELDATQTRERFAGLARHARTGATTVAIVYDGDLAHRS